MAYRDPEVGRQRRRERHENNPEKRRKRWVRYYQRNKTRLQERGRKYYAENRLARQQYALKYQREHPEVIKANIRRYRARRAGIMDTKFMVDLLGHCFYCGSGTECVDHFVPVSRGGGHLPGNVVASCQSCNSSKYNKMPEEVIVQLELI